MPFSFPSQITTFCASLYRCFSSARLAGPSHRGLPGLYRWRRSTWCVRSLRFEDVEVHHTDCLSLPRNTNQLESIEGWYWRFPMCMTKLHTLEMPIGTLGTSHKQLPRQRPPEVILEYGCLASRYPTPNIRKTTSCLLLSSLLLPRSCPSLSVLSAKLVSPTQL